MADTGESKPVQIPSLTGLRFLAAAAVVVSHAFSLMVKINDPPLLIRLLSQAAGAGMTLFFVLSGFVIFLNYSNVVTTPAGLRSFFVARFARLYPLFAICIAYDVLRKLSYGQLSLSQLEALPYYATLTQSWFYKVIGDHSLIFQFGLVPQVSWSISTEWAFYLVFPVICVAIWRLRSIRQKLISAIVLSASAVILIALINMLGERITEFGVEQFGPIAAKKPDEYLFWLTYFSPYVRIFEFALGCLVASIYLCLENPSNREQRIGAWLTVLAICGVLATHWLLFEYKPQDPWAITFRQIRKNFGLAPSLALLIFCCARYDNAFVRVISGKWIVLGGEISYSIYLLHFLIINAFRHEVAPIVSWQIGLGIALQLIVVFAAVIGLSLVSWTFIEKPSRRALRKLLSRRADMEPTITDLTVPSKITAPRVKLDHTSPSP